MYLEFGTMRGTTVIALYREATSMLCKSSFLAAGPVVLLFASTSRPDDWVQAISQVRARVPLIGNNVFSTNELLNSNPVATFPPSSRTNAGGVHTPTVSNEQRWFHNCQTGITPLVSLWFFGGRTARLGVMKSPISGVVSSGKECVSRVLDCHCHVDQAGRANTSCRTGFT